MEKTKSLKLAPLVTVVILSIIISLVLVIFTGQDGTLAIVDANLPTSTSETTPPTTQTPKMEKVKTVSVGATGDVLIHEPIYTAAYNSSTGEYDFSNFFTYSKNFIENCDYFVGNLEVTFGGTDGREYSSYPLFNTPDSLATALKDAGFDMMLTSNNHCYDTRTDGLLRTQDILDEIGLDHTGTQKSAQDKNYFISDVDGVKLGMINYTFETDEVTTGRTYINGNLVDTDAEDLINSFSYDKLDEFYSDIETSLSAMRAEGSMAEIVYLHWGDEYKLEENSYQNKIAQKLCDLGVDIIVGGHPHVIQPIELVTSTDGAHKMVVAYSLGNAVSNQRRSYMDLKTGHTEDGMFLKMNFASYNDGTALLESIEVTPTWVNLYSADGKQQYNVLAIGETDDDANGITGKDTDSLIASYDRTMDLVGAGEIECNEYLSSKAIEKLAETVTLPQSSTDTSTDTSSEVSEASSSDIAA